jgi:hypothetical protein
MSNSTIAVYDLFPTDKTTKRNFEAMIEKKKKIKGSEIG